MCHGAFADGELYSMGDITCRFIKVDVTEVIEAVSCGDSHGLILTQEKVGTGDGTGNSAITGTIIVATYIKSGGKFCLRVPDIQMRGRDMNICECARKVIRLLWHVQKSVTI